MRRWLLQAAFAAALALIIAAASGATGPWMGQRAVEARPAVAITEASLSDGQITLMLHSQASYPLQAEFGFALFDAANAKLFESEPIDAGQVRPGETRQAVFAYPPGVPAGDWRLTTWAREVVPYLEQGAATGALVESSAIVRRAPMSIERIAVTPPPSPAGETAVTVNLRLSGRAASAVQMRYALSLTRVSVEANGAFTPLARAYLSSFTTLTLVPGDERTIEEVLRLPLTPGTYTVTLWVQRETATPGEFEHFAQFTSPDYFTLPG